MAPEVRHPSVPAHPPVGNRQNIRVRSRNTPGPHAPTRRAGPVAARTWQSRGRRTGRGPRRRPVAAGSGHLPVSDGVVAQQDASFADRSRCPRRPAAPAPTRPDGPRRLTSRPVPERCSRRISPATGAQSPSAVRRAGRHDFMEHRHPDRSRPYSPTRRWPRPHRPTLGRSLLSPTPLPASWDRAPHRRLSVEERVLPGDVARGTAGCPAVGPIGGETGVRVMEAGGQKPKPATAQPGLACASRAQPMHVSIAVRTSWSMATRWSVVVASHSAKAWAHSFGDHSP